MTDPSPPNPFAARFASLNRRPAQQLMLVVVFGFVAILSVGMLAMALRADVAFQWLILRLLLGEFLIAWLVADHVTGILAAVRKSGEWQEWRLIPHTAQSLARGLVGSTRRFLWVGIGLWAAVEIGVGIWVCWPREEWWVSPLILMIIHGVSASAVGYKAAASINCYGNAGGLMFAAWLGGAIRLGVIFVFFAIIGSLGAAIGFELLKAMGIRDLEALVGGVCLAGLLVIALRILLGWVETANAANALQEFLATD